VTSPMPVRGVSRAAPGDRSAELVLRNARIHTGDVRRPSASALAVSNGRFIEVGEEADVAGLVGPSTLVIDGLGRRAVPGLCDSHLHVIRGGLNYVLELRWDGVPTLRIALGMLAQQAARTPEGQWVRVVGGWTGTQFAERRMPTLGELNAAAPHTPVFVLHLYQSAMLNRAAVTAAGFDRNTPDPPGGQIVRARNGDPTGMLLAAPAATLPWRRLRR
jgi:predicted amidohydrolase YtcJ